MNERRRSLLGMALLGAVEPLFAAPLSATASPAMPAAARQALEAELAATPVENLDVTSRSVTIPIPMTRMTPRRRITAIRPRFCSLNGT